MQAFFFLSFRRHCFGLLSHWNVCFFIDPKKPQTLTFALWACYPVFLCKFNPACLCRQAHEWFPLLSVIIRTHTCWSDFKLPVSSLASGHSHRSLKQSCFLLLAWFFFVCFFFFNFTHSDAVQSAPGLSGSVCEHLVHSHKLPFLSKQLYLITWTF